MDKPKNNRKVDPALQYRWGLIGLVLVVLMGFWYARTYAGRSTFMEQSESTRNLERIVCPRCTNDPVKKATCSLCGQLGYIWVDKTLDQPQAKTAP
jgi:hypothetical protein